MALVTIAATFLALALYALWVARRSRLWDRRQRHVVAAKANVEAEAIRAVVAIGLASWRAHQHMIAEALVLEAEDEDQ